MALGKLQRYLRWSCERAKDRVDKGSQRTLHARSHETLTHLAELGVGPVAVLDGLDAFEQRRAHHVHLPRHRVLEVGPFELRQLHVGQREVYNNRQRGRKEGSQTTGRATDNNYRG